MYEAARLAAEDETEIGPDGRLRPVVALATRPRKQLAEFVAVVAEARRRREIEAPAAVLDFVLERIGYREHLRDGTEEGEERWQNVEGLRTKLHDYDGLAPGEALEAFLEEAALVQDVDSLTSGNADAATLITLHAAKGLEFPYVFIVGLEEKLCPHVRSMASVEQLAEERRLLYVGVTRAMRQLFLVHAFRRTMYGADEPSEPSRFLADIHSPAPRHQLQSRRGLRPAVGAGDADRLGWVGRAVDPRGPASTAGAPRTPPRQRGRPNARPDPATSGRSPARRRSAPRAGSTWASRMTARMPGQHFAGRSPAPRPPPRTRTPMVAGRAARLLHLASSESSAAS
jgi:DNA helicase-2/ATP-dependent DNA helicase PcrA